MALGSLMVSAMSLITAAESDAYARDGFLVVRSMYDRDEIGRLAGWVDELASRPVQPGALMVYLEDDRKVPGKRILSRIENFVDEHEDLRALVYAPAMFSRVEALLGETPVLFKDKINFKLGGAGGFEAHQDIQPGWDDYAPFFLSALVTIDPSTEINGCLELAAGHHRRGMLGEKWKPLTESQLEGVVFEPYATEPGDVVFFDCFVPHRSAPNPGDTARRNLYLTFNRASDGDHRRRYFADKRRSYPPDCEREPGRSYSFRV